MYLMIEEIGMKGLMHKKQWYNIKINHWHTIRTNSSSQLLLIRKHTAINSDFIFLLSGRELPWVHDIHRIRASRIWRYIHSLQRRENRPQYHMTTLYTTLQTSIFVSWLVKENRMTHISLDTLILQVSLHMIGYRYMTYNDMDASQMAKK